ncbi:MAG: hypothetical protein OIN87_01720 [Candidatus Methanoperedens sp.]|nr:hypothetical protein [Candidatus Methanoperedens sp.]
MFLIFPVEGAHTFDTKKEWINGTGAWDNTDPANLSYTAGNGSTVMVLIIYTSDASNRTNWATNKPTFNGKTLTAIGLARPSGGGSGAVEMWYLLLNSSDTGSPHTVSVPNVQSGPPLSINYQVSTYKSSSGSSALDVMNSFSTNISSSNASINVTTTSNGDVIVAGMFSSLKGFPVVVSPGVLLYANRDGTGKNGQGQYYLQVTAGIQTLGWTAESYQQNDYGLLVAAFKDGSPPKINITNQGNNVTNNNSLTFSVNQIANVRFNLTANLTINSNTTNIPTGVIALGNSSLNAATFWTDFLFPEYGIKYVNLTVSNSTCSCTDYRNWTVNVLDNIAPNQVTNLTNSTLPVHDAIHLQWDAGSDNPGGSGIKDYFIDVMNNSINWLTVERPLINASNISSGYKKDAYWYTMRNNVPLNCTGCHSTLGSKEWAIGNFWMKFNSTHLFIMAHLPDNDINTSDDYVGFGFDPLRNGGTSPQTDDRWYELYENGTLSTFTGNGTAWISNSSNALRSVKGAGNGTNLTYGAPIYEIAIPLSEIGNPTNGSMVNFILEIECQDGTDFQKRSSFFPANGVYDNPSTWTTLTYRNSTQWDNIGTSTTNSYEATSLLSNFRYNFSVRARDNVLNIGLRSASYIGQTADRNGYNITGYITSGGSPVIGAHIKIGEYIVHSDSNGYYTLTDLANNSYMLIASASHHGGNSTNVTLNGSDKTNVNMNLEYFPPPLYDSRDPSQPSIAGYWGLNENVNVTGSGWDSYETIKIRINRSDGQKANESDITADANGNFVEKVIVLSTGNKFGTYTISTSEDGGVTWVQTDTFIVTGVTWYRPSYMNETLGAVGDAIIVTASSNSKSTKWANYTWKYPNGSIARTSGFVSAATDVQISDNFDAMVAGAWTIQVQFYKAAKDKASDQFSEMVFIVANNITLSASPLIISLGSNSTVTANVTNSTRFPINNSVVTFTTDFGTLNNGTTSGSSVTSITNSSGLASVNFSSSIPGTATITAVEQLKNSATIKVGVAVNYTVLTPYPEAILADGFSTSTIIAKITSNGIDPIQNNRVTFTTTLGTLSNSTVSGVSSLTAITDSNGLANVTLTSSVTVGTATITAVEQSGGRGAIFVSMIRISTQSDGNFNIAQTNFPRNQTVFLKAIGLDATKKYSFELYYPNGTLARQSPLKTGSSILTDIFVLSSDAQLSNSWRIDLTRNPNIPIDNTTFTVVMPANQTYTPQNPIVGEQMNSPAMTYSNPSGIVGVNFTWIAPNGTTARSVILDTALMQAIDTFSPNINGTWTVNVVFLNNNDWEIDSNSTTFNVTFVPTDLLITQANISVSYSSSLVETGDVRENNNVTINAIVYNGGYSATSVLVSFYDGSPGMENIIANVTIPDIFARSSQNATIYWNSLPGTHNISIRVDPSNTISESNELNNEASKLINVSAWQKYYGNISGNLGLKDQDNNSFNNWSLSVVDGNIFISRNSTLNFANLQALGRNKTGGLAQGNFTRADELLNMIQGTKNATGFSNNNITRLFSLDGTNPRNTTTFIVYGKTITNVPIVNSTNVTNVMSVGNATFITGILWDTTKDNGDGEYGDDGEEVVFIGNINVSKVGFISTPHDYEIAIPSTLGNGGVVYFNVEVKN